MSPTEQFIATLEKLKAGDLGLLRTHAGHGLDESLEGFDLFTGLWWPLRQKNQKAPRREVAWLIAKLYAFRPMPQSDGDTISHQLRICQPDDEKARKRFRIKFDEMLLLPLDKLEPVLQRAIRHIAAKNKLDWVSLTNDLSLWERENTRLKWAEQFLGIIERGQSC